MAILLARQAASGKEEAEKSEKTDCGGMEAALAENGGDAPQDKEKSSRTVSFFSRY